MTRRWLALAGIGLLALAAAGCGGGGSSGWKILFLSDRDGDWALYTMDASGAHAQRVLKAGNVDPGGSGVGLGEPVVSPDGRRVLLADRGVAMATLATGAVQHIGTGDEASAGWSPDGNRIAFSGPENTGLELIDLRSRRTRTLFSDSQIWSPTWSPDGEWIAFSRQIGYGPVGVWAMRQDGSALRQLSDYSPRSGNLDWSRDDELAFIGARESEDWSHLVVVDPRTRHAHSLRSELGDGTVAWSPDGRILAYAAAAKSSNVSTITTVRPDGSDRRRLTPRWPPASDSAPVWAPDGKTLVFVRAPVGGGAARGIPQVWSMWPDGSHRHALTTPYPDGGDNLEPTWVHGDVHLDVAPQAEAAHRGTTVVLRVPFAVGGIAAEGELAAIAPVGFEQQSDILPTPPILLWRPGKSPPARVVASSCGGVTQLVLVRSHLAFDCDEQYFDFSAQAVWVADLQTRVPHEVFYGEGAFAGEGLPDPRGTFLDKIVGAGGLLAFSSEIDGAKTTRRTLWRVDGFLGVAVRTDAKTGNVVAAGGDRLAVELPEGRVSITTADGKPIRVLPVRVGRDGQFLMTGRTLLVLQHRELVAYDTTTGNPGRHRQLPAGARLEAANGRVTVYTVGATIHLLSRTGDKVVRTGARALPRLRGFVDGLVHAALTPNGLFYCFDVADPRYPGRVVYMPME